jgi:hypothetical protein
VVEQVIELRADFGVHLFVDEELLRQVDLFDLRSQAGGNGFDGVIAGLQQREAILALIVGPWV